MALALPFIAAVAKLDCSLISSVDDNSPWEPAFEYYLSQTRLYSLAL